MGKKTLIILMLVSVLAAVFATASVIKNITLVETAYLREKGVTFKFRIDGEFRESELRGTLALENKTVKLHCNYNDGAGLLVCTAPSGTAKYAGSQGYITLAGFSFQVVIPERNITDRP
jgi:hypothetical protein